MMNNVLLATATPFFLAYGDRDSPFTMDNGIIAASTLFLAARRRRDQRVVEGHRCDAGASRRCGRTRRRSPTAADSTGGSATSRISGFIAGISVVPAAQTSFRRPPSAG